MSRQNRALFALCIVFFLLSRQVIAASTDRTDDEARVFNPLNFSGLDLGAQVNKVSSVCRSHCIIVPPPGDYTYTTPIVLGAYQTLGDCRAGAHVTSLKFAGSGAAITTMEGNTICGISLAVGANATEGFLLKGFDIRLQNSYVSGGGASTRIIHIGPAVSGATQSGKIFVSHLIGNELNGTSLAIDHVIDAHIDHIYMQATGSTSTGVVIDTGSSAVYLEDTSFISNTEGGLIIRNSSGGQGPYNGWPTYLWFDKAIFDCAGTCPNADSILFASSLSTTPTYAKFIASWAAGYGRNGFHISGGQGIKILAGSTIRSNGLNGILIDNSNVDSVEVSDNFITGNNTSNDFDAHGVYVSAAAFRVNISGNTIANMLDTTGHQKYGVKISHVNADRLRIANNNLHPNDKGYISNSDIGSYNSCGNDSDFEDVASQCWLSGDVHVHGSLFVDSSIYAADLRAFGSGLIVSGSTTVSALPAADKNAGAIVRVDDSTAIEAEGQTCKGGSNNNALAFSNGTVWKCF